MTNVISAAFAAAGLEELREHVAGDVFAPGDEGFETGRSTWNLSYAAQVPALVVMAATAGDVAAAVRYANEHELGTAVQATGHGVIEPANGALLINTAAMKGVTIRPEEKTAYVEAGAVWGDVLAPAQEVGLAPLHYFGRVFRSRSSWTIMSMCLIIVIFHPVFFYRPSFPGRYRVRG